MHYEDYEKMSAKEFLAEYEYDQNLIDDLKDNDEDIENLLFFKEKLSQDNLTSVALIFDKYVNVLNETLEFKDLAFSLEFLSNVLKTY